MRCSARVAVKNTLDWLENNCGNNRGRFDRVTGEGTSHTVTAPAHVHVGYVICLAVFQNVSHSDGAGTCTRRICNLSCCVPERLTQTSQTVTAPASVDVGYLICLAVFQNVSHSDGAGSASTKHHKSTT
ncbi:hypothetical protein RRG08_057013 [Elysia crispata]|uniref:Uncharacterized protein n=1 Tax=Elysia crispata TaxID=231223 RepID=A0AAE1DBA0_9GAST|nr:hypothetical protein RRG08_057013 [Elysia crispata]